MPIPLGILAVAGAGAGAAGSFDLLETTVLSSSTSSITFSNLNNYSDYKHLQLRYTARHTTNAGASYLAIRANSDSGTNYTRHDLWSTGTNIYSTNNTSVTSTQYAFITAGAGNTSNVFAAGVIDILDFSNSSKFTTFRGLSGLNSTSGNDDQWISLASAVWRNTAAVTSLTIFEISGYSYAANSRFSLYGIK